MVATRSAARKGQGAEAPAPANTLKAPPKRAARKKAAPAPAPAPEPVREPGPEPKPKRAARQPKQAIKAAPKTVSAPAPKPAPELATKPATRPAPRVASRPKPTAAKAKSDAPELQKIEPPLEPKNPAPRRKAASKAKTPAIAPKRATRSAAKAAPPASPVQDSHVGTPHMEPTAVREEVVPVIHIANTINEEIDMADDEPSNGPTSPLLQNDTNVTDINVPKSPELEDETPVGIEMPKPMPSMPQEEDVVFANDDMPQIPIIPEVVDDEIMKTLDPTDSEVQEAEEEISTEKYGAASHDDEAEVVLDQHVAEVAGTVPSVEAQPQEIALLSEKTSPKTEMLEVVGGALGEAVESDLGFTPDLQEETLFAELLPEPELVESAVSQVETVAVLDILGPEADANEVGMSAKDAEAQVMVFRGEEEGATTATREEETIPTVEAEEGKVMTMFDGDVAVQVGEGLVNEAITETIDELAEEAVITDTKEEVIVAPQPPANVTETTVDTGGNIIHSGTAGDEVVAEINAEITTAPHPLTHVAEVATDSMDTAYPKTESAIHIAKPALFALPIPGLTFSMKAKTRYLNSPVKSTMKSPNPGLSFPLRSTATQFESPIKSAMRSPQKSAMRSPQKSESNPKKTVTFNAQPHSPFESSLLVNDGPLSGTTFSLDVNSRGKSENHIFVGLLEDLGAQVLAKWEGERATPTHVLYKDGSAETLQRVVATKGAVKCVNVGFALDCEKHNKRMDESDYLVNLHPITIRTPSPASKRLAYTPARTPSHLFDFRTPSTMLSTPTTPNSSEWERSIVYGDGDDKENGIPSSPPKLVQKSCPPKAQGTFNWLSQSPIKPMTVSRPMASAARKRRLENFGGITIAPPKKPRFV